MFPIFVRLKRHRSIWINKKHDAEDLKSFQKNAKRLLNTCLSLGPVYIKLGQWLSSRADILPHPYLKELEKLQDDVPAAPWKEIEPILTSEIPDWREKFDSFDQNVANAASLGQVYHATLNGQKVAVKVRRPKIKKRVEEDLKVLKKILPWGLKFVDPNLGFSAKGMLAQFIETIHDEMDYEKELNNLKKIKKNLENNPLVVVPSAFDDYSTKCIITMECIEGTKITDIEELTSRGIDREKLMIDVHSIFFTMLFRYPIFHADPHPGNISVDKEGRIILYDFGMTGGLDTETRKRLVRLYLGLIEKDPPRAVKAMDELGMLKPNFNRDAIEKAIEISSNKMHGMDPNEAELEAFTELANRTMGKFPFVLPKELALYLRMASIIEGIYKIHDIEFNFAKVLRNILEKENLTSDAHREEIKVSLKRFVKSIDAAINLAPEMIKVVERVNSLHLLNFQPKTHTFLSATMFSTAIFLGSMWLFPKEPLVGGIGMATSVIIFTVFTKFRHR